LLKEYWGYALSQWISKQVEETFGWMRTVGGLRRTSYRRRARHADACLPGRRLTTLSLSPTSARLPLENHLGKPARRL